MFIQKWGCLIGLLTLGMSGSIGAGLGCIISIALLPPIDFNLGIAVATPLTVFFLFGPLFDAAHMLEIRLFCRQHGLQLLKIRVLKNHYGVDYIENGQERHGKWPVDFECYVNENQ